MGAISLTNNSIYAQKINNFSGELSPWSFSCQPYLTDIGELTGCNLLTSPFVPVQASDNAVISSEPTTGQHGAHPT